MVCGVGINDMPKGWKRKSKWNLRVYNTWHSMLNRCYNESQRDKYKAYEKCYVCDRWHRLSNFVEDLPKIENYKLWLENPNKRIALDKDIKSNGQNKCYCLEECIFATNEQNVRQSNKTRDYNSIKGKNSKVSRGAVDIKNNITYGSVLEASKETGIHSSSIYDCCYGRHKTTVNKTSWMFLDNYELYKKINDYENFDKIWRDK